LVWLLLLLLLLLLIKLSLLHIGGLLLIRYPGHYEVGGHLVLCVGSLWQGPISQL